MGNTLAMLDWPSSTQWAAGAGCGLATLALGGGGGGGAGAEAGASGVGLAGRSAQRAAATALCAAAALAVGDALLGRWARLPLPGSDSGRAPLAVAADYDDEEAEGEEAPDKSARGLVVLTGCDSGLGFSLAAHSLRMGLRVAAGCLDADGPGARRLLALAPHGRLTVLPLDVTKSKSVLDFTSGIEKILLDDKSLRFLGLVNNAGIMIFGEFEWQTESQVERQIQVNLLGTMRVTRRLCPLLRRHQGRVITVTSHCALEALPGLAPYGATKAALEAWCAALRVEQQKYGVRVITLVPGSFTQTSNIMAHHEQHALEMETNLRQEYPMDWEFYENYFRSYHNYLMYISGDKGVKELNDRGLYFKYECCLLALWPKQQYVHAPMRYNVYHLAMRISPRFLRDQIVKAFMKLPPYKGK